MSKQSESDLLNAIKRTPVSKLRTAATKAPAKTKTGTTTRGKATNLYLHATDTQRIRDLAGYVANQGLRVSDSMVVKAALLLAQPDGKLLEAYKQAAASDQRFKR